MRMSIIALEWKKPIKLIIRRSIFKVNTLKSLVGPPLIKTSVFLNHSIKGSNPERSNVNICLAKNNGLDFSTKHLIKE